MTVSSEAIEHVLTERMVQVVEPLRAEIAELKSTSQKMQEHLQAIVAAAATAAVSGSNTRTVLDEFLAAVSTVTMDIGLDMGVATPRTVGRVRNMLEVLLSGNARDVPVRDFDGADDIVENASGAVDDDPLTRYNRRRSRQIADDDIPF